MINKVNKDLLSIKEGIIVHGCNAQGVMGAGIALQLRKRYPRIFIDYINLINRTNKNERHRLLGLVLWTKITPKFYIANAITQEFYGRAEGKRYVSYDAIEMAFKTASDMALILDLPLYFHKIGASLGGGNWAIIENIIENSVPSNVEMTLCVLW